VDDLALTSTAYSTGADQKGGEPATTLTAEISRRQNQAGFPGGRSVEPEGSDLTLMAGRGGGGVLKPIRVELPQGRRPTSDVAAGYAHGGGDFDAPSLKAVADPVTEDNRP
jgi:hypothetical protein